MMSLQIPPAPPAKRSTNWRESEVMDLLDIWGEEDIQQALRTTRRNQAVYERIASEMTLRGHNRDWHQCRAKAKVLKAHYKKAREANRAGGGCKVTCAYYEELSQILEEDDSTEALYIVDIGGNPHATEISDASDREEKEDTPVLTPIIIKEEALEIQEESPSSQETSDDMDIKPPAPFWQDIHLTSHQTRPSALCPAASSSQPAVPSTFPTPGHLPTILSQTPPSGAPQLTTAGQASPSPGPSCLGMQTDWLGTPPPGPGEMSISSEHKSLGKQVTSNLQTLSPIIELNVGGEMYITTLSTLKKHPGSKLAEMFTGQPKLRTDSEGRYFIDRPGTYFKYILEYLRSNQVPTQCVQDVYKEALYYDIEPLIKQLEDSPQIFGELVARKQFLARVPSYSENLELMIRIARAEAVASRQSSVMVCVVRTEEDVAKCHEALNSLDTDKKSVVKFGPWKATPTVSDLLDCIKMDVEAKGYNVSIQPHVAEKGFRFKSYDFFYKFVFTWW